MRALVVTLLLSNAIATAAIADSAERSAAEPVIEPVIEDVKLEDVEPIEYDRSAWLLLLPVLCALVVAWNIDWKDARVKAELVEARARRAPKGSA